MSVFAGRKQFDLATSAALLIALIPTTGKFVESSTYAAAPGAKATVKPVVKATAKSATSTSTAKPAAKPAEADEASASTAEVEAQAEANAARTAALSNAVKAYKAHPDSTSWDTVWHLATAILTQPAVMKAPFQAIVASYPGLKDAGVKVIDGEGARIWCFPNVPESQSAVLQWTATTSTTVERPVGRRHRMVKQVVSSTVSKAQILNLPTGVTLYDAHLVHGVTVSKDGKAKTAGVRALVLTGNTKGSGAVWLQAYHLSDNNWTEGNEVFSGVPPFLTQNLIGKASFSGNDLVLTVGAAKPSGSSGKTPASSGYKIVLHFIDGKFTLNSGSSEEGPALVAVQFMQAVQQGRFDLAKGWLVDPRLISIPKYMGLTKPGAQAYKLIAMASPGNGSSRYRLMTFDRDDLIFDIGKYKAQWAIKGIFVAPPDPLAQKLVGTLGSPATDKSVESKATDEAAK